MYSGRDDENKEEEICIICTVARAMKGEEMCEQCMDNMSYDYMK